MKTTKQRPMYMMCLIGKTLEQYMGITKLTAAYNRTRAKQNLDPINEITIKRYNNGASHCTAIGVPVGYAEFLTTLARSKFKAPKVVKATKAVKT